MIFGTKSAIVSKKKIKSYCDKVTDFHDIEMPKACSNCTCFAVTLVLFLKKMKTIIGKCFRLKLNILPNLS